MQPDVVGQDSQEGVCSLQPACFASLSYEVRERKPGKSRIVIRHLTKPVPRSIPAEFGRAWASRTKPKTERVSVICDAHGFFRMGRTTSVDAGWGQTVWLGSGAAGRRAGGPWARVESTAASSLPAAVGGCLRVCLACLGCLLQRIRRRRLEDSEGVPATHGTHPSTVISFRI